MEKISPINSIQVKIGMMLIVVLTGVLTLYGAWQYWRIKTEFTRELNLFADNRILKLQEQLYMPLWEVDGILIDMTISSEMGDPRIFAISVNEENTGDAPPETVIRVIKVCGKDGIPENVREKPGKAGYIFRSKKIMHGEKHIGTVELYVSREPMFRQLKQGTSQILTTILILNITLIVFLLILLNRIVIRPVRNLLEVADEITEGDFSRDISVKKNDEIGMLADALRKMKEKIVFVSDQTTEVILNIRNGKLDACGQVHDLQGKWRELVHGINGVTQAFVEPINITAEMLDSLAKGDIPERIEAVYKGDFNRIINNLNKLIDATNETTRIAEAISDGDRMAGVKERSENDRMMKALNRMIRSLNDIMNETREMIESVGRGKLDVRGNAEAFEGGWRELVTGINNLIEGLSHAVSSAAALSMEMKLAKKIQTVLLPRHPEITGYEIAASCKPSEEVGGDYYDVISVGGFDWIVIGDVSGHGVTAGLVMMMVQTAIHTVLNDNPETEPSRLLSVINKTIYNNIELMDESKHMTIVVLAAGKEGKFSFSGLHEDILIRRTETGKVEKVESGGMWIGLEPDISGYLSDDTLQMEPGDCMVLFTDGITEALCEEGRLFGDERLIGIIEESDDESATEIRENIINALEFCETPDDVTLVVIKRM